MNDTKSIIYFLQMLHYRDDLEINLFDYLTNRQELITSQDIIGIYRKKVHSDLIKNTQEILTSFGVLKQFGNSFKVDKSRLDYFINLVQMAKESRNYKWPELKYKPYLYISPPNLISTELSGEVDDISNFLIDLVSSAKLSIAIMSPFTNKDGLRSILTPLKSSTQKLNISLYLVANKSDENMIFKQVKDFIPSIMINSFEVYFCSPEDIEEGNLPHAKLLIVDSSKGYLGSANFTRQGLTSRFEVGVELDQNQSRTVIKLLDILLKKAIFKRYTSQ